ncbi:MAG: hypothetical protein QM811_03475 [Pirellulales bacterium]
MQRQVQPLFGQIVRRVVLIVVNQRREMILIRQLIRSVQFQPLGRELDQVVPAKLHPVKFRVAAVDQILIIDRPIDIRIALFVEPGISRVGAAGVQQPPSVVDLGIRVPRPRCAVQAALFERLFDATRVFERGGQRILVLGECFDFLGQPFVDRPERFELAHILVHAVHRLQELA